MTSANPRPPSQKPTLTTNIPPINREPVELDGTPTSPRLPTHHRFPPRAETLDSTGVTSATTNSTMSPGSTLASPPGGRGEGAAAIAEASIEGARVGAGIDAAALRMNGQIGGNREGEGEMAEGAREEETAELREHRAALLSSRSRDPAVLVDIPQTPAAEELAAAGATSDAPDGEVVS